MDEFWQMALAALVGAGGLLGGQGLVSRFLAGRHNQQQMMVAGEQGRQTTMAEAVVAMTQTLNEAMIALARESLKTASTNILQLITAFETEKTERALQLRFFREALEQADQKLDTMGKRVEKIGDDLTTLVRLMAEDGGAKRGERAAKTGVTSRQTDRRVEPRS